MLLNQWKSPNCERGGKAKSCSTALPAKAARRRRGRRDAFAGGGPEHRLPGDKQRFCRKVDNRTRNGSLYSPRVTRGVGGVAVAAFIGGLPVAETEARAGLPMAARTADDRPGPGPPPPPPLSSAGRRENRITKITHGKKSRLTPCTPISRTPPWPHEWRPRGPTSPWSVAYLFSPCFGLS